MKPPHTLYYLGPAGTHSDVATQHLAALLSWKDVQAVPLASISEVIQAIESEAPGESMACVPLENSVQGSVTLTWDRLMRKTVHSLAGSRADGRKNPDQWVLSELLRAIDQREELPLPMLVAALREPIHHHLLTLPGADLKKIAKIYSHPQVLAQCKNFLEREFPKVETVALSSSAEAAKLVRDERNFSYGALGNAAAATLYELEMAWSDVEDDCDNVTRFGLLSKIGIPCQNTNDCAVKTLSLCLTGVGNRPGGLLTALTPFQYYGLNLSRIESRPVGGMFGYYDFFVDVVTAHHEAVEVGQIVDIVVSMLEWQDISVLPLGYYYDIDSARQNSSTPAPSDG